MQYYIYTQTLYKKFRRLHCIRSISFESIELYKGKYIVEIIWIQMLGETQRFLFWLSSKIIIDIYKLNPLRILLDSLSKSHSLSM